MSVRFDATTERYKRTANLPTITGFSLLGWFRISADRNTYSTFFYFGDDAVADHDYGAQTAVDGTTLQLYNGASSTAGSALTVGTWYHIALVVSGTGANQAKLYLNGVQDAIASGDASATAVGLYIGNTRFDDWLNGNAAAVKIYDAVLTADEIANEMRCYAPIRTANLNGWYPMADPTIANDAKDCSGNGYDLTATGTLTVEDGPPIPWRMGQRQRALTAVAGGTNTTVTPGLIALATGTFAPVLGLAIIPPVLALATTKYAPVLSLVVIPPVTALTTTLYAPVYGGGVVPSTLSMAITAYAPRLDLVVIPPVLAVTATGLAPVVALAVIPDLATLTFTTYAAVYGGGVVPGVATLTTAGYAPTITFAALAVPGVIALVTTGFAPTVGVSGGSVSPDTRALTLAGYAPFVIQGTTLYWFRRVS